MKSPYNFISWFLENMISSLMIWNHEMESTSDFIHSLTAKAGKRIGFWPVRSGSDPVPVPVSPVPVEPVRNRSNRYRNRNPDFYPVDPVRAVGPF
ncbi:hypothetical protein H5410_055331 [Solanum commersonii]|uniref:Uncharacterized protein n=1 Tax=Solanum commersonii TaxID=4109 RepID=A0A9J5WID7_SOLCO|nr:hypothetical protein H5410_055331 [Solanum commersonii]